MAKLRVWRRMPPLTWLPVLALAVLSTISAASSAGAQGTPPSAERRGMRPDDPRRVELERRFQQRMETMVRERLQLTDEQAMRLREVASRTEEVRRNLRRDEMLARRAMRDQLLAGDSANEARVSELLEQLPRLERRRLELFEQEQRDLAKFLSPVQRARYFALQDELRRGMQELQRRRMGMSDSTRGRAGDGRELPARRRPPAENR